MNKTTELLQQLNTMQNEHIKLLNERIEVLQHTIELDNKTLNIQSKAINRLNHLLDLSTTESKKIYLEDYDNRYINFDVINTFNE
tara:strand:- start:71 stop:325 length:255 start_codon:yes stop_codon:yes gene_type:complete